jgi:REP element-mobilizing transposase RayT
MRLPEFDYATPGTYFVTICTLNQLCLFGQIYNGIMHANRIGAIVTACWNEIPTHYPFVELDAFALTPNHLHGLLRFAGVGHALGVPDPYLP